MPESPISNLSLFYRYNPYFGDGEVQDCVQVVVLTDNDDIGVDLHTEGHWKTESRYELEYSSTGTLAVSFAACCFGSFTMLRWSIYDEADIPFRRIRSSTSQTFYTFKSLSPHPSLAPETFLSPQECITPTLPPSSPLR